MRSRDPHEQSLPTTERASRGQGTDHVTAQIMPGVVTRRDITSHVINSCSAATFSLAGRGAVGLHVFGRLTQGPNMWHIT